MAEPDITETFIAMPVFKWVKADSDSGFLYNDEAFLGYRPVAMKLVQAWKGNKGGIEYKDVDIEL